MAIITQDVPPFWIVQSRNSAAAVNVVGMRRAGIPPAEIQAVRKAYNMVYRSGEILSLAVARMDAELGHLPAIQELVAFIRSTKRGIPGPHRFEEIDSQAA